MSQPNQSATPAATVVIDQSELPVIQLPASHRWTPPTRVPSYEEQLAQFRRNNEFIARERAAIEARHAHAY